MRAANITAGIAVTIWVMLGFLGYSFMQSIVAQQVPGYPNNAQIILLIGWPLFIAALLLACAWACNTFGRWAPLLGALAAISIFAVIPWVAFVGGGV